MNKPLNVGDLVISIAGRDKGEIFLVVDYNEEKALIVDGKTRKIKKPKNKNIKHLKKVSKASLIEFALRIRKGESVANEKVFRAIKAEKEKIQED